MNSVVANLPQQASAAVDREVCFHCALPVPAATHFQIRFDGNMRALCCAGCEAVARTIIDAGLAAYYTNRTAVAAPAAARAVDTLFDLASVQSAYVAEPDGSTRKADLYIDGITCAACVWLAESALARVPGVTSASVNQVTHRASVAWNAGASSLGAILDALSRVGLGAQPASASARFAARRNSRRRALFELGVALLGMMQVMMFTLPLYFSAVDDVSPEARLLMGWAGFVLTLPVILFSARSFFVGTWRDLARGRVSMDLPIALAIVATFATSSVSLFSGGSDLYFDSISMFVFLLLAARYLESWARESSLTLIERLTNATPATAWRMVNGAVERVAAAELRSGDTIRVATGEAVAADGVIIEGESEFDESLLTGESRPVARGPQTPMLAGALNLGSPVLVRVTRTGEATTAASLARLTEQALASRPTLTLLADRVARWIAPLTIALALLAAMAWWLIDPSRSFSVAVAVLAVTCPCALALAAPAAQALAITRLAREGLLITRAGTLDKLAAATDIAFDKTGTLTEGRMAIEAVHLLSAADEYRILAMSAALEAGSPHPVARAIATALAARATPDIHALPEARNLRYLAGEGVEGEIDGARIRLGRLEFVQALAGCAVPIVRSEASLFIAREGAWLAAFELSDPLKADAAETLRALQRCALTPHLLSGDRSDRVERVASSLGIAREHTRGAQSPTDKLQYSNNLAARWIAVGDGVNDAPFMAAADVSIAMGSGADLTRLGADAGLLSPRLMPLATARRLAMRMQRIIAQNFFWAISYNLVAVPLAIGGFISPAWAAIGMASSSLLVVANSLRLTRG